MELNRRDLLLAGAAGAGLTSSLRGQAAAAANAPGWFDRPMRWAQLAFTEDDPGNYDPQFWLEYFERIHADAACLSAGGIVAFYPTEIPLHYRSKYLGNRDSFGELVAGCRKLGMNVIARTDPHACREEVFQKHPDWVARLADGQPRRHWANPELYVTCALGPYNFEFMTQVTAEIVRKYKVDGVFSNRWAGHGQCWCEHCRANFRRFSGMDLPRSNDPRDPARRQYIVWEQQRLFECWKLWDAAVRKENPNAAFIPNSGGGATSKLDMKTVGEMAPILFADRQARRGVQLPWANGKNGKEYRAGLGMKPIGGLVSVGLEEPYRWKDSVQSGTELRIWFADAIANGLRPWFVKFNAKPFDKRWMPVIESIYKWHWRNESYFRNTEPVADVAIVFSQQTAAHYGGERAGQLVEDHILGYYHALIEARIPFEMVHDGLLGLERIRRFRVLILPNIAALSDRQCRQLIAYVEQGGAIVATHATSLYNEWGEPRSDFGLASLFGCSYAGKIEERQQNSYLNIEKHPLTAGLEDAGRIVNAVKRVHVTAREKAAAALTLVPSYPDLPMEDVFPRVPRTDISMAFCRTVGKGRVVYFPMDLDRTFWEVLSPDHGLLLKNAVIWASNQPQPVQVTGKGLLDVTVWRQSNSLTVHLVNLTNPMTMKGPFRETFPVGPFQVTVRLPSNAKPVRAKLLTATTEVPFTLERDTVRVTVPGVDTHEVVAFDFS